MSPAQILRVATGQKRQEYAVSEIWLVQILCEPTGQRRQGHGTREWRRPLEALLARTWRSIGREISLWRATCCVTGQEMFASPTIGEAIVSAARGMLPSTITTERGMTATGGMATARALCSCWAVGGVGMAATGIRPGAMTRMPGIRMMGQSTLGTRI